MHERPLCRGWPWISFVLLLPWASCASDPPPVPATPAGAMGQASVPSSSPLPPFPRSSIAAVVLRRTELGLSDDQVRELELRDQEREREDAAIRDEIEKKRKAAADAKAAPAGAAPGSNAGGRGGGGGMRGGGMRGGAPRGASAGTPREKEASIQDRLDANDTKAYLDGEELLKEEQRERAREIASDYREKLYERRETLRAQAAAAQ